MPILTTRPLTLPVFGSTFTGFLIISDNNIRRTKNIKVANGVPTPDEIIELPAGEYYLQWVSTVNPKRVVSDRLSVPDKTTVTLSEISIAANNNSIPVIESEFSLPPSSTEGLYVKGFYKDAQGSLKQAWAKLPTSTPYQVAATSTPSPSPTPTPTPPTNIKPVVTLNNPGSLTVGQAVTLSAIASDSDGSVVKVEFYRGSTKLGEKTTQPYSISWTPSTAGSFNLTAIATDNQGGTTTSAVVTVSVSGGSNNQPPSNTTVPLRLTDASPTTKGSLGIGLNSVNDYSGIIHFLNIAKNAREYITGTQNTFDTDERSKMNLDERGWLKTLTPTSTASFTVAKLIIAAGQSNMPAGRYVVRWTGSAVWDWFGASVVESSPNRQIINVPSSSSAIWLNFTSIDPNNYFKDLIVVRETQEALLDSGEIFNPDFLEILSKFQCLRFMDWQRTNYSPVTTWASRSTVNDYSYASSKGVPVEIQVALCNKLNANGWFNVPHMADDGYVIQFATYLKDNLNPTLKAYIEYSNEIWNPIFSQGIWMDNFAQQRYANQGDPPFTKRVNWFGWRTDVIGAISKGAFGAESNRVICVLGCQAANTYGGEQGYLTPLEGTPRTNIDAIAIAPYFNAGGEAGTNNEPNKSIVANWTVDDLFVQVNSGGLLPGSYSAGFLAESKDWTQKYKTLCDTIGTKLIAYEGGQHFVNYNHNQLPNISELFENANRSPKMYDAYTKYFSDWKEVGGELFCHFVDAGGWSQHGYWGALENMNQYEAGSAKFNALWNFMINNPQWW